MRKNIFILLISFLAILAFSTKIAHSQEQMNITANVPDSSEARLSEAQLSTLTADKTQVAQGEIAILKLSLVGYNRQLLPKRNITLSFYVDGDKIGEIKGITDINGTNLTRIASQNKLTTTVIASDDSSQPPVKILSELTLEFAGNQGKEPQQKVDLLLNTKGKATSLSFIEQVIGFFRRVLGILK